MQVVALDVHRTFAEIALLEQGLYRSGGKIGLTQDELKAFGNSLTKNHVVVLEATGNTQSIVYCLQPYVKKVVIANPFQVKAIAHAKVKTDKVDAKILAELYAAGYLPEVWIPDEDTVALRRQVMLRQRIVQQRTRVKNTIHSVLHTNLIPVCPYSDLFGRKGRAWLKAQPLPDDELYAVQRHLRELDRLNEDLHDIEHVLAKKSVGKPDVERLMTIGGVNATVAIGLVAAIGRIDRFPSSRHLVSYFGLNPSVHQSGLAPARHGRISKRGRSLARALLVEAAWSASRCPGPLRGFYNRIRSKRGAQIAAVATARKLAVIMWHLLIKKEDYHWKRPALVARKVRSLQLKAGYKPDHSGRGIGYDYNLKSVRDQEMRWAEQAESAYGDFVRGWKTRSMSKTTA